MTMTDKERDETPVPIRAEVVPYRAGMLELQEVQARIDRVRALQEQVLVDGRDYGVMPGTERPALLKSGAETLLLTFQLGHRLDKIETEFDEHGRKLGVTYRCTAFSLTSDGVELVRATCDGYAGYEESRYFQSVEQLEARERFNADKYQRQVNPTKFAQEYRAPWNTVVKMAEKRALVGCALQATAASGLFTQDLDDDQTTVNPRAALAVFLGYDDVDHMVAVNDPLKAKLDAVPRDRRQPLRDFFAEHGLTVPLPVALALVERFVELIESCSREPAEASSEQASQAQTPPEAAESASERPSPPSEPSTADKGSAGRSGASEGVSGQAQTKPVAEGLQEQKVKLVVDKLKGLQPFDFELSDEKLVEIATIVLSYDDATLKEELVARELNDRGSATQRRDRLAEAMLNDEANELRKQRAAASS